MTTWHVTWLDDDDAGDGGPDYETRDEAVAEVNFWRTAPRMQWATKIFITSSDGESELVWQKETVK